MNYVSELLDGLTGILEGQARTRITDNMPETPTAILYTGEKSFEASEDIMNTLRKVWRGRADDLCQLVFKEGAYHSSNGDPLSEAALQELIDGMFAQNQSFRSMNGLLLCAVINTADYSTIEQFRDAYLALDDLQARLGMSASNTMKIVLLDESGMGRALATQVRTYLRTLLDAGDSASKATVILSNRLKNGVLLAGTRIRENYALAGNLILLANGSNKTFSPKFARMFPLTQPQFLTASYSSIQKPNSKICEILVNSFLNWLEARFNKGDLLSTDDISKQLEITGGNMKSIERFFQQNIADTLPRADALDYLPRNNTNLEPISGLPFAEFNRITMDSFDLFYQNTVKDICTSDRNKRLFRDSFLSEIRTKFTPREAARSVTAQTVEQVLRQVRCDEPSAALPASAYWIAKAKVDCCRTLIPICEDALKEVASAAKNHIAQITDIIQDFQHSYMLDVDETLQQYYHELAVSALEGSLGQQLLDIFNQPDLTKGGMLEALYNTISLLFTSEKIFGMPLEQEMTLRMGGDGKQVQRIVQDELTDGLSDRVRLQTGIVPDIAFETILVNQKDDTGNPGTFYSYLSSIFVNAEYLDTGNSNSIEFVQLYTLDAHML